MGFLLALITAVGNDQTSMSRQQLTDGLGTQAFAKVEEEVSNYWNAPGTGVLAKDAQKCKDDAGDQNKESADQAQYQTDSAAAQSAISQNDGTTQSAQNQTGMDSSNLQNLTQLAGTVNAIGSTTASLLAQSM